ncbi:MAG: hypothetical protein FD143_1711 [Ignavibacteria bacterium]|nr:MAG: hypothetical protein FD143_1711 [Ignavibacteria bacterium]KAF0160059.1 MAG: hypothetical protein FD188_1873 [Ignavibacteria bacterium]
MKGFYHLLIVLLLFYFQIIVQAKDNPSASLPDSINGWKKLGADRTFNEQNLYEYIDGAAELYISFGFSKVFNRIYYAGEGKEIIVDIFYMNTSQDAFGAFSFTVGKISSDFGMQSQITSGSIVFWKNNFVVSIMQNPESDDAKETSYALAKLIDESIKENGSFPEVLKYLPEENLNKESVRYFRHYVWLNTYSYISDGNILNITQNTHGLLAKYGGKENLIFLLVKYPNEQLSLAAAEKFNKEYFKSVRPKPVVKQKNKFSGTRVVKNFFIAVLGGSKENSVKNLLTLAQKSISGFISTK